MPTNSTSVAERNPQYFIIRCLLFVIDGVRADCLATNTEYCDRCTHAATQATNVARIKTEGTKGLLQGQVAG
jgi:hypothetical protein